MMTREGIDLVKEFESFRARAYLCPAGKWTIGWGHTAGVKRGDVVTHKRAEELLAEDLAEAGRWVDKLITGPLTPVQYSVLCSFVFNLGPGALRVSTLRKKLNAGHYDAVPGELARWIKARVNGNLVVLGGLVRRRAAEGKMWKGPSP